MDAAVSRPKRISFSMSTNSERRDQCVKRWQIDRHRTWVTLPEYFGEIEGLLHRLWPKLALECELHLLAGPLYWRELEEIAGNYNLSYMYQLRIFRR